MILVGVFLEGGMSVLRREVRTLLREMERKSKGNPIGNLLELERNLKELHLEQQPAASSQQPLHSKGNSYRLSSQQPAVIRFQSLDQRVFL